MLKVLEYPRDRKQLLNLLSRRSIQVKDIERVVQDILNAVSSHGDSAVARFTREFDKVALKPSQFLVTKDEIDESVARIPKKFMNVLESSAQNIRKFHHRQKPKSFRFSAGNESWVGLRYVPVERAGVYVPGGQAAYPSTVLMNVIPAQVAGVPEIIIVSPPDRNGNVSDVVLAAAHLLGISSIYKMGGIQAIAALTCGTKTISKVNVIVGPGNKYVTAAKKAVMGQVGIDSLAGPSEVLILADEFARADFIATDMLGQAEHDTDAMSCLVTPSKLLAEKVQKSVDEFLRNAQRNPIITKSLRAFGRIIITPDMTRAEEAVNLIAPEHLEIITKNPSHELKHVHNAGAIFLGNYSPVAIGDYFAGPNHVLPTSGSARFASPLSVMNFMKASSVIEYSERKIASVADEVAYFAEMEGLFAHAESIRIRRIK